MLAVALALALGASGPGVRASLPPAPLRLYKISWQRPLVPLQPLEKDPLEPGGVAVDPATGTAIFGTRDGWLHAIRPDGTVAWELRGGGSFGPAFVEGTTVYVGSVDGGLYAVDAASGKLRWRYDAKEDLSTRPSVLGGLVYVASLQDAVFAVDAQTGAWRWHHRREQKGEAPTIFGAAPALATPDAVFAAYSDGFVAALEPRTGQVRWERLVAPAGTHRDVDALMLDGGRLYAAAYSGAVLALDVLSGQTLWSTPSPGVHQLGRASGLVLAGSGSALQALSPADGGAIWTTPVGGAPAAEPALAGKWLLVPTGRGGLRWLEAASGRLLRVFDPGTGVSGPVAVAGGRVYVLSNGGDLFALDLE
jgi:outer membrane protein assembly factor BamB